MAIKRVFYKGVGLWDDHKFWLPSPISQGTIEKQGTGRKLGAMGLRSRNYLYDIPVHTVAHIQTAIGDLDFQGTFDVSYGQIQKSLVEASDSEGDLCVVQDIAEVLSINTIVLPEEYPGEAAFAFAGSGFAPAVGQYVLLREPTSEAGFVTQLTGVAGANLTAEVSAEIDATWEMYLVRYFYPHTAYITVQRSQPEAQMDSSLAFDIMYLFKSRSHLVVPTAYVTTPGF